MKSITTLSPDELELVSGGNPGIVFDDGNVPDHQIGAIRSGLAPSVPRYRGPSRLTHDPRILALRP